MTAPEGINVPFNERNRHEYPWRPMDNNERLARWAFMYKWKYGNKPREDQNETHHRAGSQDLSLQERSQ